MGRKNVSGITIVISVLLLAVVAGGLALVPLERLIEQTVAWGQQHIVAAPAVYIGLAVVTIALFMPGAVVMMLGGFLFGFVSGSFYAAVAIALGAQCAFVVARRIARPWVQKKIAATPRFRAVEAALHEQAFLIILLTRLSLILPFNVLNYAYGATAVRASTHFVATAVGMLPALGLYVYIGSIARDLGQVLSGEAGPSELRYWTLGAGVVIVAAAVWVIHRTASRALRKHLVENESVGQERVNQEKDL